MPTASLKSIVVKPILGTGSDGVSRVDSPDQLGAAFALAGQARSFGGVLCEEFVPGPEVEFMADKDVLLLKLAPAGGAPVWITQFGSAGEDKGMAVAAGGGAIYIAGMASDTIGTALP